MKRSVAILIGYAVSTVCYILFHFSYVHTNRLTKSNNTVIYILSFCMFFLIPLMGVVHLSLATLRRADLIKLIRYAGLIGIIGPVLLHFVIAFSDDGEAGMAYLLVPIAYLAFCLFGYILLFAYLSFKSTGT